MGVFAMPSLGADMEAGTLVEWLVKPGDKVHRGDVVAVVETQKGAIEIEIFEDGTVQEILAELGSELPVGAPLAVVLAEGNAPPAAAEAPEPALPSQPPTDAPDAAPSPARPPAPRPAPPPATDRPRASPAARQRADALGVDISTLRGSGPGGAILLADVEHAAPGRPAAKPSPIEEMRKAIAAAMTRAKRTIPHFYLSETIDVDPAIAFLEDRNAGLPPDQRILLGALFVRAATLAAAKVKVMNGHYIEDRGFVPSEAVNTGVAIALRSGGLVAPALMDAGSMTLAETMAGMRDLVTRTRAGRLRGSEMTEGTITVSSLGETGAEAMTGVIFPPQVALVGIGAPHLRPWVVEDAVVPRHVVTLTLSADHRVSDGRQAARFIAVFEDLMKRPEDL
ncbi:dihydrolipoamide acetyltransferase family protein [Jannaschia seohaensis]|uniref:Dihydrolipoamide acetyltransferase component of pyruvate dehydrogenase complex n=1 Tax=Jannaschia seohaensis TaxID=475081 RepID=A0A2Y9C7K5_9RHOB|nr:dihydrolipoamide acetyltransferase family protein [Jannaschia seohaensis]PWJ19251.1 pyruvate dehydrogenase E2 component (dihydrolipoamide acetyltransferase) [Jannaschia seohaensis]SSA45913.1 pyruvate dehydrogenase E2 component (dihydrolipoamide acetyltransferase) [Jannaschia seohaensis]